jgi:hypothetical protein
VISVYTPPIVGRCKAGLVEVSPVIRRFFISLADETKTRLPDCVQLCARVHLT